MTSSPTPFLRFRADGHPEPQGSKRVWMNKSTNRPQMTEAGGMKHASWRREVTAAAREALPADHRPITSAVSVLLTFSFIRGIGHYGTGSNAQFLKPSAPTQHTITPDVDKLIRAILDAVTVAGVWVDDSQVVAVTGKKRWADRFTQSEGVDVVIGVIE